MEFLVYCEGLLNCEVMMLFLNVCEGWSMLEEMLDLISIGDMEEREVLSDDM